MEQKLNFIIVCDKAEFDNGKFNIKGGFDKITSTGLPATVSNLSVIAEVEISAGDYTAKLHLRNLENNKDQEIEGADSIKKLSDGKHRTIFDIANLLIQEEGKHVFDYYLNGTKLGSSPSFEFKIE